MAKKILSVTLLTLALVCALTSCGECEHVWGKWETEKSATCTNSGTQSRTCTECGEIQTETITATGHAFSEWSVVKNATCTEAGTKERTCTCGARETEKIAATGHSYGEWEIIQDATCIISGTKERVCICGQKEMKLILAKGHHTYGDWITIQNATCTEYGIEECICFCGERTERSILPFHKFVGSSCSVCGAKKPSTGLKFESIVGGYKVTGIGTCTDTDLVIPSIYNGAPVLEIGNRAFWQCENLVSVTIPDSVQKLGNSAFCNCNSLASITMGNGITTIQDDAFSLCNNLEEVHISDLASWCRIDFKSFSANPFYYEANLYLNGALVKELTIPEGITTINNYAFYKCKSITSVIVPDGVTKIGEYAFRGCSRLSSVILSDTVEIVKERAFYCDNLSTLYLGNGLTDIERYAFYCGKLKIVYYNGTKSEWDNIFIDSAAFSHTTIYFNIEQPK